MTIQQVLLAGGWTPTYATWNSADKSAQITLSNSDLTAANSSSGLYEGVRATFGKSSGKWYWEVEVESGIDHTIGIANSTASMNDVELGSDANGWGWRQDGEKYNNGDQFAYGGSGYNAGDVIGIALDMNGGTLTFYLNGVSQGQAYSGLTGTLYPAVTMISISQVTANFGPTFTHTPPSGHLPLYS